METQEKNTKFSLLSQIFRLPSFSARACRLEASEHFGEQGVYTGQLFALSSDASLES